MPMPTHAPHFSPAALISNYDFRNRHTHYRAWGVDADWSRTLSPRWRVNARAGAKKTGYGGQSKDYFADYKQYETGRGGGIFHHRRKAVCSPTLMQHAKPIPKNLLPARNIQHGWERIVFFQAVLTSTPSCFTAAVFMTRQNFVSDNRRRRDNQYIMIAVVGFPQWNLKGVYPEFRSDAQSPIAIQHITATVRMNGY